LHLTGIDFLLWAAGFFGHIVLLAVLLVRDRARTFPIFTTLIVANVVKTLALYLIVHNHGSKHSYLVAYSSLAVLDLLLQLGVVYELASHVFRPLGKWTPEVRNSSIWIVGISAAIAICLTYLSNTPPSHTWLQGQLIRGNFFSAALISELFVGMIVLSLTVRLPWKTHVARISQGFGFYSIVCILIEAGHSYLGMDHDARISSTLSRIRMVAYLISVGYWIVMLWLDAPAPKELSEEMRLQLISLQRKLEYDLRKLRTWRS
jgi:hypothetical protein